MLHGARENEHDTDDRPSGVCDVLRCEGGKAGANDGDIIPAASEMLGGWCGCGCVGGVRAPAAAAELGSTNGEAGSRADWGRAIDKPSAPAMPR